MKIHTLFICGLAAAAAVSCNRDNNTVGDRIYTTHFIQGVTFADALECRAVEDEGVIYLNLSGTSLEKSGKGSTEDFLKEIGDTAYNRYIAQIPLTDVYANRFTSVDITSSEQFLDIPAGESVAKYVIFRSATALPYIESMYTAGGFWSDPVLDEFMTGMGVDGPGYDWFPPDECNFLHPVIKTLPELTQDDLFLLWVGYPGPSLRFTSVPEIKSHIFTITMTDSEGGILTCSVPFTFPKQ